MVRTQIQLTEVQAVALREMSAARNQSLAELIRKGVDLLVEQSGEPNRLERAKGVVGRFASGSTDGSRGHDKHLANAFGNS